MNVLMLTPYLPYPPVSGGRMRTYSLVKRLHQDHQITLVCFGRPEEQAFDLDPIREFCDLVVVNRASSPSTLKAAVISFTSIEPITMRLYRTPEMKYTLAHLLNEQRFDVVHVESFYMFQNLPQNLAVPVLLSEPAIEYVAWWRHARVAQPVYQRPGIALEALKMRVFEPRIWKQSDLVGMMSETDRQIAENVLPKTKIVLTPNGVDVEYFQPSNRPRQQANAIFMGDYKYFPNADAMVYFVREIMPLVQKHCPEFSLTVLGKDPSPELVALGEDKSSGVIVTGLVDDTRPYLHQATLFVCPLRSGSGTRFKLMEAMASGLPVVTTTIGGEGLFDDQHQPILIADTPQTFADAILKVIREPETAQNLATEGRAWVVQNHAWEHSATLVTEAYQQLLSMK